MENNEFEESPEDAEQEPTMQELADFCKERWSFPDEYVEELVMAGDFASAFATATLWAQELDIDVDEFLNSLIEAGLYSE